MRGLSCLIRPTSFARSPNSALGLTSMFNLKCHRTARRTMTRLVRSLIAANQVINDWSRVIFVK